jgi:hypothetical protein
MVFFNTQGPKFEQESIYTWKGAQTQQQKYNISHDIYKIHKESSTNPSPYFSLDATQITMIQIQSNEFQN